MPDTGRGIIRPHLNGGKDRKKSQRHYQFTIFPTDDLIHGFRIHIHPSGGMIFEFDNREVYHQFDERLGDALRKMRSFFAQEERIARKMGLNLDGYHIYLSGLSDSKYQAHQQFLEKEMKDFYDKEWDKFDAETKAALERDAPIPRTFDTIVPQGIATPMPDEFTEEYFQGIPINREGNEMELRQELEVESPEVEQEREINEQNSAQTDQTSEPLRESTEVRGSESGHSDGDGQASPVADVPESSGYAGDSGSHESGN